MPEAKRQIEPRLDPWIQQLIQGLDVLRLNDIGDRRIVLLEAVQFFSKQGEKVGILTINQVERDVLYSLWRSTYGWYRSPVVEYRGIMLKNLDRVFGDMMRQWDEVHSFGTNIYAGVW